MPLLEAARAFQAAQNALRGLVRAALAALWAELDQADLSGSWARQRTGERAYVTISAYQALAARYAGGWVRDALAEQDADPLGPTVQSRVFAGRSSDGGLLEPRLYTPVIQAKTAIQAGARDEDAIRAAGKALERIGVTEAADASRAATTAALTADPAATGWVRQVNLPACGRCVAQAGQVLDWDEPIRTHPSCDCEIAPAAGDGADELLTDPIAYFESLPEAGQAARFGAGAAAANRAGTPVAAAVGLHEARSGMAPVGELNPRATGPTVRSLLADARGDRDAAVRLLREHGFVL